MKQKGEQINMSTKAEHAAELHQKGCIADAVALTEEYLAEQGK